MDGSNIEDTYSTVDPAGSNECPASEWYAIRDYLSVVGSRYVENAAGRPISPETCLVRGQNSARDLSSGKLSKASDGDWVLSSAYTEQAVVSDTLSIASIL